MSISVGTAPTLGFLVFFFKGLVTSSVLDWFVFVGLEVTCVCLWYGLGLICVVLLTVSACVFVSLKCWE